MTGKTRSDIIWTMDKGVLPMEIVEFSDQKVRRVEYNGEWYFSIVDIVGILTESSMARRYWTDLKRKLKEEEGFSQLYEKIVQLKLEASDGKKYATDCASIATIFRIIQSIPSPRAEPIKQWLAKVGYERIEEIEDPSLAQERMMELYRQRGYDEDWIHRRIQSIKNRKELTNEWSMRGAVEKDYSIFTALMSEATFGLRPKEHKEIKGLRRENLRDHMTEPELVLTMLGEVTAKEIHRSKNTQGKEKLKRDVKEAGEVAGSARRDMERRIGKSVVSSSNYLNLSREKIAMADDPGCEL